MIILALDLGEKRVGVAKSDGLGLMAHALPFIEFISDEQFAERLAGLLDEIKPEKVLIGHPKTLEGTSGIAAQKIEKKTEFLKSRCPGFTFELWDERLTSKEAENYLRQSGASARKRKGKIDSLSAQILLQSYLDSKRS